MRTRARARPPKPIKLLKTKKKGDRNEPRSNEQFFFFFCTQKKGRAGVHGASSNSDDIYFLRTLTRSFALDCTRSSIVDVSPLGSGTAICSRSSAFPHVAVAQRPDFKRNPFVSRQQNRMAMTPNEMTMTPRGLDASDVPRFGNLDFARVELKNCHKIP